MSPVVSAVIVAAGNSSRMKSTCKDKLFLDLGSRPVLARTLQNYQNALSIHEIVVVCKAQDREAVAALAQTYNIRKFKTAVVGGSTRAHSVLNGLAAIDQAADFVAIADGARPFTDPKDIDRVSSAAFRQGAAILCTPVKDTIKQTADGMITATPKREDLYAAQTPQTFERATFSKLLTKVIADNIPVTDDASVWEMVSGVVPVIGSYNNIKITTPEDIALAKIIAGAQTSAPVRIGHGYDVHRLVQNRKLILCGQQVPYDMGLLGHSDADVAVHALMDAILGALALGDIGQHFPDTDPAYKNADSMKLLAAVFAILQKQDYQIGNIDLTILAQRPKLSPFLPAMRQNLAAALQTNPSNISIKATTEEGLGFTGKGEGIAAHCVCLLIKTI